MRNTLLDHLYTGFDRDPDAVVALTLTHPGGVLWSVTDSRIFVATESGSPLADLPLDGTLDELATSLTNAGMTVSFRNPELASLNCRILIGGSGSESSRSGNVIYAHRSVVWALMSAYSTEVEVAAELVPPAIEQAYLHSADGDWLDYWGEFFKIPRHTGQNDADYLTTMVRETLRHRSNKYAIENAVKDSTGNIITIDEPWTEIFMLDKSTLSGPDKIKGGSSVGRNLIRPVSHGGVDWATILPIVNRNRAAGVIALDPLSRIGSFFDAGLDYSVKSTVIHTGTSRFLVCGVPLLDFSSIEDVPVANWRVLHRRTNGWWSFVDATGLDLTIASRAWRTYRSFSALLTYPSQSWTHLQSWGSTPYSWSDFKIAFSSGYTRSA